MSAKSKNIPTPLKTSPLTGQISGTPVGVIDLTDDDDSPLPKKKPVKDPAKESLKKENIAAKKNAEAG